VTTDLPAALGFTATAWLAWRWLLAPSWRRATCVGASLGAALLFKFSCLLLAPLVVIVGAMAIATHRLDARRAAIGVALIASIAYAALWAGYGFRYAASSDPGYVLEWQDLENDAGISFPVRFAREHRLLPEAYLFGFAFAKSQSTGRVAYLDGEQSLSGWYRYFPEAFLFKTPPAFIILAIWVIAAALRRTRGKSFDGWCLALPPLLFAALAVQSRFNIGHRHITPVYPFLCVAMAPAAGWLASGGWRARAAAVLTISCFVSFALATPGYLSYFNVLAGGPRGGVRHLVDSNIDWGQDLGRLRRWMRTHDAKEVDLAYFGTADPQAYGIAFRKVALFIDFYPDLQVVRPESGHYLAASVTLLTGVYMDADRAFAREILRRGFVEPAKIHEYLAFSESRQSQGLTLIHLPDWMSERGLLTAEQRRAAEDVIPATWLRKAHETLEPVGWAGDSIAIYRIP
jgi:hypothetical protein